MLIGFTGVYDKNRDIYIDANKIVGIERIDNCDVPHTNIYTSIKYMEVCAVEESPVTVYGMIEHAKSLEEVTK